MNAVELLETIVCTAPWTLDDSRALYDLIHNTLTKWPDTVVDVHCPRGTQVHVRIETYRGSLERTYDVV